MNPEVSRVPSTTLSTMSPFPATIKAITFSKTGEVDVLEKTELAFPQQGPGDVILKVRAYLVCRYAISILAPTDVLYPSS